MSKTSKSRVGIIFALVCLATSITFAQSFFSSAPPAAANSGTSLPAPMTPDEFKSLVQQQTQQSQSAISQQASKAITAAPFPAKNAPPVAPAEPAAPGQPQQGSGNPTVVVPPVPDDNQQADQQQPAPQPYTGYQSAPPTSAAPAKPAAPASGGNGSAPASGSGNGSSGWGIKY
jgi:hypothetical protein